jgi:hypothetical protein
MAQAARIRPRSPRNRAMRHGRSPPRRLRRHPSPQGGGEKPRMLHRRHHHQRPLTNAPAAFSARRGSISART